MRLTGLVYRAHNPRWAFAPACGQGAAIHGGRFNPIGREALYTSCRLETAWLEAQQGFPFKAQPMTICAYEVDCEDVLNLVDPATLGTHDVAPGDLACPWEAEFTAGRRPASWIVADRLIADGIAGIVVPSFARGAAVEDVNAVFWRWSDVPPHQVLVVDPHGRLPRDASAWR